MNAERRIKAAKYGYIIASILCCVAGALMIVFPSASAKVICAVVGAILAILGVIKVIGYFSKDLYRLAFQFDLAFGLLCAIVGIIMLCNLPKTVVILHFMIGIIVLADALFKIQTAVDAKVFGIRQWWYIALLAAISAVLGLLLIVNPFEGAQVLMIMMGVALLFEGILNLCVAQYAVQAKRLGKAYDEMREDWKR